MVRHVTAEYQETRFEYGYICDCCHTEISHPEEALLWRESGGYNSIFGDGTTLQVDLCQHCIRERLGDILQVGKEPWAELANE